MNNLYSSFLGLPNAATPNEFNAIHLSTKRKDFLAKNADGAPVFLLHDSSVAKYNPSINFRHLSAVFHATCRVQTNSDNLEDQFCLVSCDATAPELHELFIRCVAAAVEELPDSSSTKEIESCITQLRDLFRALALPSNREVSGLWAELFVILKCGNPEQAMSLWHEDQFDRFDFANSAKHIEVKSTVRGLRAHEFALEQLSPPARGEGFVISLLLQPLSGGSGILDLAREIEAAVTSPRLKQKLWENVAKALGADYSDKLDKCFDQAFAERCLVVYAMNDIPRPETPSDPRVSALRFVSDLTAVSTSLPGTPSAALARIFRADSATTQ
ncbi:MAG: PD-(D/E)XK motif protein [Sideroxydans sp.]|nr:PD-(D/E)XK motif protein [Sideroxydans sp.]